MASPDGFILPFMGSSQILHMIDIDHRSHPHPILQPVDSKTCHLNGRMPLTPSSQSAANGSADHRDLTWQRRAIRQQRLSDEVEGKSGNEISEKEQGDGGAEEWCQTEESDTESSGCDDEAVESDDDDEYDHYSQLIGKLSDADDEDVNEKKMKKKEKEKVFGSYASNGTKHLLMFGDDEGTLSLAKVHNPEKLLPKNHVIQHGHGGEQHSLNHGHNLPNFKYKEDHSYHNANSTHKPKVFRRKLTTTGVHGKHGIVHGKACVSLQRERPIPRTWSLTDDDMDELRGSIDLGFGFAKPHDQACPLKTTLPALEFYHAINKSFIESKQGSSPISTLHGSNTLARTTSLSGNLNDTYRISSSGDSPNDVKLRLRHWAQAVACSLKEGCFTQH